MSPLVTPSFVAAGEEETLKRLADCARSIALLKSNEAIMVRRYKAVSESEADLRRHCQKLKEDMVSAENGMIEKMGTLQRYVIFICRGPT